MGVLGALHHVMGRGIERGTIFPSQDDRTDFVSIAAARRRELRNEIERAIILSEGSTLRVPRRPSKTPSASISWPRWSRPAGLGPKGAATLLGLKHTTIESRHKKP